MKYSEYDKRMKEYEFVSKTRLMRRVPVIVRVDGKNFSSFCKRFEKPYDQVLHDVLNSTMLHICENVMGCKFAERHSDEISLLLTDYDNISTEAYFDYNVQKICSVVAATATAEFCRVLINYKKRDYILYEQSWPKFDCRCFNIPNHEVINYFYWRQKDALRNSISMLAQSKFSHKKLHKKNSSEMQEMLFSDFGINWNDIPQQQKTGFICVRKEIEFKNGNETFLRNKWTLETAPKNKIELEEILEKIVNPEKENANGSN